MKLYLFPPSARVLGILALRNYLALDCETRSVDLERGDQLTPQYLALNLNKKRPTLEDGCFVLWESNAIVFYMATKQPHCGLWPSDQQGQADVLRWLAWESAHWDAESIGMVAYEKVSKAVLGRDASDAAFIARGKENFERFAAVLNESLKSKTWIIGERLTIADFSVGGLVPSAERLGLPLAQFPEISRWYQGLARLSAWETALALRNAALVAWQSKRAG